MEGRAVHKTGIRSFGLPILQTYALAEVFKIFCLALVVLCLIFIMTSTVQFLHKGIPLMQFVEKLPFIVLYFLPFILPVAMLSGITLGLGRMVQEREVAAMRAAGINYMQIALPVLIFAFAASFASIYLMDEIIPFCYKKQREVQAEYVRKILSLRDGSNEPIRWNRGALYLGSIRGGEMKDVIYWQMDNDLWLEFRAAGGRLKFTQEEDAAVLELENVVSTQFRDNNVTPGKAAEFTVSLPLRQQSATLPKAMPSARLFEYIAALKDEKKRIQDVLQKNAGSTAGAPVPDAGGGDADVEDAAEKEVERTLAGGPAVVTHQNKSDPKKQLKRADELLNAARAEYYRRTPFAFSTLAFALLAIPLTLMGDYRNRLLAFFKAFLLGLFVCFIPLVAASILAENGKVSPHGALWAGDAASVLVALMLALRGGIRIPAFLRRSPREAAGASAGGAA
jgi:lipopolysaccharide export LptBFGC system permease protein LptF